MVGIGQAGSADRGGVDVGAYQGRAGGRLLGGFAALSRSDSAHYQKPDETELEDPEADPSQPSLEA
jgi:hypothetical protein